MSFTKKYLDQTEKIILDIENRPGQVYRLHANADTFIGTGDKHSIELINEFLKAYDENPKQDFNTITEKYK
jgi:hypothetical protein